MRRLKVYKAKFDFCKKKIKGEFGIQKQDVKANFNLELKPDLSRYATKEDLDRVSGTYIHEQGIASDIWVINHNLDKRPSVTVVDTADTVFMAEVVYNDNNTCTVYINGATKGKAYLN